MERIQLFYKNIRGSIEKFKYLGQNSSVHGLKWIFEKRTNSIARIFWISILLASAGCLFLLLKPVVFERNNVRFTPDTLYLHWTTTFPAVTVCEEYNSKLAQRRLAERYPNLTEALNFDYRRYLTDLAYGRGSCSRAVCKPCGDRIPCDVPWRNIVRDVHLSCDELLTSCQFNTENFICCKEFLSVDSEYGPCYSFNSLQTKDIARKKLFVVNKTTGPGILSFRLISDAQVSIHSTEELSTNVLDTKFKFNIRTQMEDTVDILFSMKEVENEARVRHEDIDVRKCRYIDEVPEEPLHTYPVYSYGACRLVKSTEESLKYCGCVHPARDMSYRDEYCNFTGLNCLVTYEGMMMMSVLTQKTKLGIETVPNFDDCWPSCEENELSIVHISRRRESKHRPEGTLVNLRMSSLPTMRYQKTLLHSNLDLVVSIGGMVGLFFGASILSLLEILYLIIRSPKNNK